MILEIIGLVLLLGKDKKKPQTVKRKRKMKVFEGAAHEKVLEVCTKLGINPDWLYLVMNSESGLNPQAVNGDPIHGGATGLIQFMPATAIGLGTTTQALYKMNAVQQLDYVYKYFLPYKKNLKGVKSLYLVAFHPASLPYQNDLSHKVGSEVGNVWALQVAQGNPGLKASPTDVYVTIGSFFSYIDKKLKQ